MPFYDESFSLGDEDFPGCQLSQIEEAQGAKFDNKGKGNGELSYVIPKEDAARFLETALGKIRVGVAEDGTPSIDRVGAIRHPEFHELVAQHVTFTGYQYKQDGDTEATAEGWRKAVIEFDTDDRQADQNKDSSQPEERTRWKEQWDISCEVVPVEVKVSDTYSDMRSLYFPIAKVSLNQALIPNYNPNTRLAKAGKINQVGLEMPSGITIAAGFALFLGVQAEATRKEIAGFAWIEWDVTSLFGVKPHSWNQGRNRNGEVVNLTFPNGAVLYQDAGLQSEIDI
jgi:hypothetical protein